MLKEKAAWNKLSLELLMDFHIFGDLVLGRISSFQQLQKSVAVNIKCILFYFKKTKCPQQTFLLRIKK